LCILWTCFDSVPPENTIRDGFELNPDGAGIAWFVSKNKVRWQKGLETVEELLAAIQDKPLPLIIHCRIASVGGTDQRLTHPFPINPTAGPLALEGEARAVLAHNGHWGGWEDMMKRAVFSSPSGLKIPEGPWSDTRAMAWLAHHFGLGMLDMFPGKLALMHSGQLSVYGKDWARDNPKDGFYQSSACYKSYRTGGRTWSPGTGEEWFDSTADVRTSAFKVSSDESLPTLSKVQRKAAAKSTTPIEVFDEKQLDEVLEQLRPDNVHFLE
jgi:hypothetical protein